MNDESPASRKKTVAAKERMQNEEMMRRVSYLVIKQVGVCLGLQHHRQGRGKPLLGSSNEGRGILCGVEQMQYVFMGDRSLRKRRVSQVGI